MHQLMIIKYQTKMKVRAQKASLNVEAMVFNPVHNWESKMAAKHPYTVCFIDVLLSD